MPLAGCFGDILRKTSLGRGELVGNNAGLPPSSPLLVLNPADVWFYSPAIHSSFAVDDLQKIVQ
jgi:hypothetical protein